MIGKPRLPFVAMLGRAGIRPVWRARSSRLSRAGLHRFFPGLLLLLFVGLLTAHAAEDRLSLDGPWHFTIDPQKLTRPAVEWDTLPVPGNWDTHDAYSQHVGRGTYQRTFTVPAAWRGRRIRLHFGAVYETAEVSLNSQPIGKHEGGYTPFDFDITDRVKWNADAPNTLTVVADNTYRRGAWWAWGGISRSVTLIAHHDVRLVWQHIRAEPDLTAGTATVHVEYLIENAAATPATVTLDATAPEAGAASTHTTATAPAGSTTRASLSFTVPRARLRLWHFDHPHLYTLTTRLTVAGQPAITSELRDRFGIRKIEVKPDGLHLNGERVRVVGFNRVHDHRAYGNTEPDHLVRLDVDRMKRYGGNFMRIMHAPAAPNLLDYLDEKGVMVFTEIPVWGDKDPNVIPDNPRTQQWLREMVNRDYNHPSIIGWSVGNELLNHFDYVKSMIDFTRRELDPHRLISYVSYSGAREQYDATNDPISVSDLILHNSYGPNPGRLVDLLAAKWPNRPVFFAELGSRQFGEPLDSRIPGLEERWESLASRPHVIGAALWTFNDYRSNYRGSAPGELRSWGIVDLWRRDKAAARDIARLHSPIRSLRIRDGKARLEPRSGDDFPSYTLRGYKLLWEWRAPDGTTHGGGIVALPDIAPGSAPLEFPLTAKPASAPADAINLVVTLLTPLGYIAHETATLPPGDPAAAPLVTGDSAPVIHHAEPLDGGFMLGYSTQPDDVSFTAEYGGEKGNYPHSVTSAQKGAFAIRGLENGRTYYVRLRRTVAKCGPSVWSPEVAVTPDGGQPPAAPKLLGVVRGSDLVAVRFAPARKATGYRIRFSGTVSGEKLIAASEPGIVMLDGAGAAAARFTVTALNTHGESAPSDPVTK